MLSISISHPFPYSLTHSLTSSTGFGSYGVLRTSERLQECVLLYVGLYHRFQQFNFFNFQTRFDLVLQHSRGRQLQELIIHTVLGFGEKNLSIECFMMIARIYTSQRIKKTPGINKQARGKEKHVFKKINFFYEIHI